MSAPTLESTAFGWLKIGVSVIPVLQDGSKKPAVAWDDFQTKMPSEDQVRRWLAAGHGIGICTGRVEMFEFEGRAMHLLPAFEERLKHTPHPSKSGTMYDVWKRLWMGCSERSPSGGLHVFYLVPGGVADKSRNTRLSMRPATAEELKPHEKPERAFRVEIETRSKGGYSVMAPTPGWVTLEGGPDSIAKIQDNEREALFEVARSLSTYTPAKLTGRSRRVSKAEAAWSGGLMWEQILEPAGWSVEKFDEDTGITYWRHPSAHSGHSATVGSSDGDDLYVFSTSTEFESEQYYSKLDAVALLEHGGDVAAARKQYDLGTDPEEFFETGLGLLTTDLVDATLQVGPVRYGSDLALWCYDECGVWRREVREVGRRLTRLLDYRFRTDHVTTVRQFLKLSADPIEIGPRPGLINFSNGMYDWNHDRLIEHDAKFLSVNQLAVAYNPEATCPQFDEFLGQVLHADDIERAWEIIGYLLIAGNPLQKAFLFRGTGRNGKGVFQNVIEGILGTDNVAAISLSQLNEDRFKAAELFGKIANICGDIDSTYQEKTAAFKMVTGDTAITVERKGQDPFKFLCWATPVFSANEQFGSADTSEGFIGRWELLEFPNSFLGREDPSLSGRLLGEVEGVAYKATKALRGLMARNRFVTTASGEAIKQEFSMFINSVHRFISECCVDERAKPNIAPNANRVGTETARGLVFEAYQHWCEAEGIKPLGKQKFFERVKALHYEETRSDHARYFRGLRLVSLTEEYEAAGG